MNMNVLIATPTKDGQVTIDFMKSFLMTLSSPIFLNAGINLKLNWMSTEGDGICRARNLCATAALKREVDKILFVDADIAWTPEDVLNLLVSEKDLVGGAYPLKRLPIKPNFNVLDEGFAPDTSGVAEVKHVATGFMMIDVKKVLGVLVKGGYAPKYAIGVNNVTPESEWAYDFFPMQLVDVDGVDIKMYETEDWGFCSLVRKSQIGVKVYLHTKVLVDHIGSFKYSLKPSY